jgi:hypothetical protein
LKFNKVWCLLKPDDLAELVRRHLLGQGEEVIDVEMRHSQPSGREESVTVQAVARIADAGAIYSEGVRTRVIEGSQLVPVVFQELPEMLDEGIELGEMKLKTQKLSMRVELKLGKNGRKAVTAVLMRKQG